MLNEYVPAKENSLHLSWHDSAWIPILNPSNVLDYFAQTSNPFYDRTCNNEVVKMQRLNPDQLQNMVGVEYILLHVQEPILYVIRKQLRHSPTHTTALADYYILAGVVYQCPDLNSLLNSRIMSALHHLQSAFDEMNSYKNFHPSKGYSWDFSQGKDKDQDTKETPESSNKKRPTEQPKDDAGSRFQRRRVDFLLAELTKKFPPKLPTPDAPNKPAESENQNAQSQSKAAGDANQGTASQGSSAQGQTLQPATPQQQQSQQTQQQSQQQQAMAQTPGTPGTPIASIRSEKTEEKSNPPSNTSTSSSGSSNAASTASNTNNNSNNLGKLGPPPEKKLKTS